MSEAPRWPGSNGSPGLDFSRDRRRDGATDSGASPARSQSATTAPEDTVVRSSREQALATASTPLPRSTTTAPDRPARTTVTPQAQTLSAPVRQPRPEPKLEREAPVKERPPVPSARGVRRTRKARLRISRVDPWSVMKTSFLFSIAAGIIVLVSTWLVWTVFESSGALEEVSNFLATFGREGEQPLRLQDYLNGSRVMGFAAIVAAIDVVILTALATLFAFLYNLAATVIGGLEVTLAED